MFGRELKAKLPELRKDVDIADTKSRDRDYKKKGKIYADDKRWGHNKPEVKIGQKVLLQNKTKGTFEPNYETILYMVITKQGKEVTIQSSVHVHEYLL